MGILYEQIKAMHSAYSTYVKVSNFLFYDLFLLAEIFFLVRSFSCIRLSSEP